MGRMPSIVPIAPELEREGRTGQMLPGLPDDGWSGAANAVASEFKGLAQKVGLLADHAAGVEGKRAGHLAGMDPEFRTQQDGTIRGEAFDQAGLATAKSRISTAVQDEIQTVAEANKTNPQAIAKALAAKQRAWEASSPQELRPQIQNMFASGGRAAFRQATRALLDQQNTEQRAAQQAELDRTLRSTQQMAYAGGLDDSAVQASAANIAQLQVALARTGLDGKPLVAPQQAVKLIADAKEIVAHAQIEGAFDRLSSREARARLIERFEDDYKAGRGVAADFDFKSFQQVRGRLETKLRTEDSRARQANGVLGQMVKEVGRRASDGEPVRPDEIASLQSRVATANDPALVEALDDGVDALHFMQQFKTLPVPAMEQAVDGLRQRLAADPASLGDKGRTGRHLKAAEAMLAKAQGEIQRNPLAWEGRVGMAEIVPLGTVDMTQPGAVEAWGSTRVAQADEVARRHGLARPQYLEPGEKRALAKSFEQGGERGLATISAVRRAFGDRAEAVLREMGKESPGGALLADLAIKTGPTPAVNDAAEGLALFAKPGHKRVAPEAGKARIAAEAIVGRSLGEATPYLQQAMRVADAIYETRAHREGKTTSFDERLWQGALNEALGEHQVDGRTFGGLYSTGWFSRHKIVLPPSVPQDKAGAILDALTPEDLGEAMGAGPRYRNGRALTRQELRAATLVTTGPGKYLVATGDATGTTPGWALAPDGKPYVLDLEAALPGLRRRRPDLR